MSTPAPGSVGRGVPQVMASQRPDANGLRPDLAVIADWIAPGSHVLDDAQVLACARRGVDVIQQDIEAGLDVFAGSRFDVVVLSMAIQATHQTERVLREMSRLGAEGIVSFPNFGHWSHAWSILRGRMPISREMPYRWYDTPNLHLSTPKDFEDFLEGLGLAITRRVFLADGRPVAMLAGLRCTQAIYGFRVR